MRKLYRWQQSYWNDRKDLAQDYGFQTWFYCCIAPDWEMALGCIKAYKDYNYVSSLDSLGGVFCVICVEWHRSIGY
jgi:hypothetical protein